MWPPSRLRRFGCDVLLRLQSGHYPRSRWRVDTEGVPVALLTLLGHPPDVRFRATAALAGIPLHVMVLSTFGHLVSVGTSFRGDLRSHRLINREDSKNLLLCHTFGGTIAV